MRREEFAARVPVLAVLAAIVVGIFVLTPHIRNERLAPIELQPSAPPRSTQVVVHASGEGVHEGLYSVDASTSLTELLQLISVHTGQPPESIAVIVPQASEGQAQQRVDVNHAAPWLLEALPGIGAERARAIVQHRTEHGPFRCVDDLMLVPGIGPSVYEAVKDLITVTP